MSDEPEATIEPSELAELRLKDAPLYAISEVALEDVRAALHKLIDAIPEDTAATVADAYEKAEGFLCGLYLNGPIQAPLDTEQARLRALHEQQSQFFARQVDSLVQRLVGAHMATGFLDMNSAQGFIQKEIGPINAVLQQIAAAHAPVPGEGPEA